MKTLLFLLLASAALSLPAAEPTRGPLRVHPANPHYFTDGSGKAVFLTGSHTWGNLQDYTYEKLASPPTFEFDAYLAFLKQHNHNFFRLWAWDTSINPKVKQGTIYYHQTPYQRTGPEAANDGKPRFDLTLFNQAHFDRMRARVVAARDNGIYASVMLFNGFAIEGKGNIGGDPWQGNVYNPNNNINGVDGGGSRTVHTLANPAVVAHQEAYVRKVIDTVNDLDNVLYEITNEDTASPGNTDWQYHMIRLVNNYEATKPKQHAVGMTYQWPNAAKATAETTAEADVTLYRSPAVWVSPGTRIPPDPGGKILINDTDHSFFWTTLKKEGVPAQRAWVWKNFTMGYQCIFMDPYLDPNHDVGRNNPEGNKPDPYWEPLRESMGQSRRYATRMNLADMFPHGELASSKFCLANPGQEYLIYLPDGGEVTADLSAATGELAVEWMRVDDGTVAQGDPIRGGAKRTLKAPVSGDAVLYIHKRSL